MASSATGQVTDVQRQMDDTRGRTLGSSRRILALTYETESLGNTTLEELGRQGEVLSRIEGHNRNVNASLRDGETELRKMESLCFGLVYLPGMSQKRWEKMEVHCPAFDGQRGGGNLKAKENVTSRFGSFSKLFAGGRKAEPQNPNLAPSSGRGGDQHRGGIDQAGGAEDELARNMGDLSLALARMKEQGLAMGRVLDVHDTAIDNAQAMAASNSLRAQDATRRARKLVR